MKYLAVTLGLLCAASAHSAGKYTYLPTKLTITYNVSELGYGDVIPMSSTVVDLANPSITVKMNRQNETGATIPLIYKQNAYQTSSDISTVGPTRSTTSLRFGPNTFAWVTMQVNNPLEPTHTTTMHLPDKEMYWPQTPHRQDSSIGVQCAVPEYVTSDRNNLRSTNSAMTLYIGKPGHACIDCVRVDAWCMYDFEIVPEIKIELKNDHMRLTGVSGTPILATNQLIATGWGGRVPASLRIDNPYKEDISISFSQTNFDQTTTTVKPTETGAPTDFYVKVNNTSPGSREYRVNFTAQFA